MPTLYDTGFGCKDLTKLRINGPFVFPPLLERYRETQALVSVSNAARIIE